MKRLEVIYLAVLSQGAQPFIHLVAGDQLMPGARNGAAMELAKVINKALQNEVNWRDMLQKPN